MKFKLTWYAFFYKPKIKTLKPETNYPISVYIILLWELNMYKSFWIKNFQLSLLSFKIFFAIRRNRIFLSFPHQKYPFHLIGFNFTNMGKYAYIYVDQIYFVYVSSSKMSYSCLSQPFWILVMYQGGQLCPPLNQGHRVSFSLLFQDKVLAFDETSTTKVV